MSKFIKEKNELSQHQKNLLINKYSTKFDTHDSIFFSQNDVRSNDCVKKYTLKALNNIKFINISNKIYRQDDAISNTGTRTQRFNTIKYDNMFNFNRGTRHSFFASSGSLFIRIIS